MKDAPCYFNGLSFMPTSLRNVENFNLKFETRAGSSPIDN